MFNKIVSAALLGIGLAQAANATSFTISGDFGTPVFAYGRGSGGGNFIPYLTHIACQPQLDCYPDANSGNIVKNISNTAFFDAGNGTVRIPAGTVHFHPLSGGGDTDSIIRFIAPTTATWQISGQYWRNDITAGGNGTQLSVFKRAGNTAQLIDSYGIAAGSYGQTGTFTPFGVALQAGDIIEFALNNRGDYSFDSTGIEARFTSGAVPEPASWAMLIAGFGLVGAAMRRGRLATA